MVINYATKLKRVATLPCEILMSDSENQQHILPTILYLLTQHVLCLYFLKVTCKC